MKDLFLEQTAEIIEKFGLRALIPLQKACEALVERGDRRMGVAVLGRFKAGKSSFINDLLEKPILPVGVTPVTAVMTYLRAGLHERTFVEYLDGRRAEVRTDEVAAFVAEAQNPGNEKQVSHVEVEGPFLSRYPSIELIDSPGLGNLLNDTELGEVKAFIGTSLKRELGESYPIYLYSIRREDPRARGFHDAFEGELLFPLSERANQEAAEIAAYKTEHLRKECISYLTLALAAVKQCAEKRSRLKALLAEENRSMDQSHVELRHLTARLIGETRPKVQATLQRDQTRIENEILAELKKKELEWVSLSLWNLTRAYESWLRETFTRRLSVLSRDYREELLAPLRVAEARFTKEIQSFKNRIATLLSEVLGIRLSESTWELSVKTPNEPDISIGRVFDFQLDILSFMIPMRLVRGWVYRHLERQISWEVEKNLSRLGSLWTERITPLISNLETQAKNYMHTELETVEAVALGQRSDESSIEAALGKLRKS